MWLLNVKSYRLEWIHDRDAAEKGYAILSHTWAEEEVSFQDIQDLNRASLLIGFKKIELTCKQARLEGLGYVWIDTCCIDKKSSAELSEAINSMFDYYASSNCCYVYLDDVDEDANDFWVNALVKTPAWLQESRWLTRGWTLQELIAPSCVKFFSRTWIYIGTRSTLAPALADTTGIDVRILHTWSTLEDYTIAQRLSWAAGRQTTRLEDRAYSLLGLLGVNMPLLYGEGDRAFERLQREIIKDTDDQSVFLWQGKSDDDTASQHLAYPGILAPSPNNFENAGDIVLLEHFRNRPFDFTNSGLRITIPIVCYRSHWYAVFNCRYRDDFRGPLAVRVHSLTAGQDRGDEGHPRYGFTRRIDVIPMNSLTSVKPQTCFLVKSQSASRRMRRVAAAPIVCSFWLRGLEKAPSKVISVEDLQPQNNWNPSSAVIQWTREAKDSKKGYWGHVSFKYEQPSRQFFMNLLLQVAIEGREPRYSITAMRTRRSMSKFDFQEWYNVAPTPAEALEVRDLDDYDLYESLGSHLDQKRLSLVTVIQQLVRFSAEVQEIFGNLVCVVEFGFGYPDGPSDHSAEIPKPDTDLSRSKKTRKRKRNW